MKAIQLLRDPPLAMPKARTGQSGALEAAPGQPRNVSIHRS